MGADSKNPRHGSRIEANANQIATRYRGGARVRHAYASVGEQSFGSAQAEAMMTDRTALGTDHVEKVTIEIESKTDRSLFDNEIAAH